ncbi:MAG: FAD-dependent oxidoreductase [Thermoplasmata archaeon]|nr:FAD-dependent oxidoreductase [Thermoplasmata archaeon]
MTFDVGIIGFGPAGMSAAIYAKRFGLSTIVFEHGISGGNAALSPLIENYLGFPEISGSDLVAAMENHAKKYVDKFVDEKVADVSGGTGRGFELETRREREKVRALIIATGTKHRELGVPGEQKLRGRGVSYCATCDGFFFRNKKVAVIGGGNTAAVEALYLRDLGAEVYLIHRRDKLRAEEVYYKRLNEKKVNLVWNTVVKEILGEKKVEALRLENRVDGTVSEIQVNGVFVAIGDDPQNEIPKMLGVTLREDGYVAVDQNCRTNVKHVYACGDITGLFNQVVVAAAQGALAARSAYEDLTKI